MNINVKESGFRSATFSRKPDVSFQKHRLIISRMIWERRSDVILPAFGKYAVSFPLTFYVLIFGSPMKQDTEFAGAAIAETAPVLHFGRHTAEQRPSEGSTSNNQEVCTPLLEFSYQSELVSEIFSLCRSATSDFGCTMFGPVCHLFVPLCELLWGHCNKYVVLSDQ